MSEEPRLAWNSAHEGEDDPMTFAEKVEKISILGTRLNELRAQRDVLNSEISKLEAELRPLVAEHAKDLAQLVGVPSLPSPVETPVALETSGSPPGPQAPRPAGVAPGMSKEKMEMRRRIVQFLKDAPPGMGAMEVAERLKMDPAVVREITRELATGR